MNHRTSNSHFESLERMRSVVEERLARQRLAGGQAADRSDEPNMVLALSNEINLLRAGGGDVETFITNFRRLVRQHGDASEDDVVALLREASLPPEGISLPGSDVDVSVQAPTIEGETERAFQMRTQDVSSRWDEFKRIVDAEYLPRDTYSYLSFRRQIFGWLAQNPDLWMAAIALGQHTRHSQIAGPIEFFFYHHQIDGSPVRLLDRFPDVPGSEANLAIGSETTSEEGRTADLVFDRQSASRKAGMSEQPGRDRVRTAVTDKLIKFAMTDRSGVEAVLWEIGEEVPQEIRALNKHLLEQLLENAASIRDVKQVFDAINNAASIINKDVKQAPVPVQPGTPFQYPALDVMESQANAAARLTNPTDTALVRNLIHHLISTKRQSKQSGSRPPRHASSRLVPPLPPRLDPKPM